METYGVNTAITLDKSWSVTLSGDGNILPHVHTEVVDGVLRIDTDAELYPSTLSVHIVMPTVSLLGCFDGADLSAADIETDQLEVLTSGIGNIELSGTVRALSLSSSSSGVHNASELLTEEVELSAAGPGLTWITVTDDVEGSISGGHTLNVFGDPYRKAVVAADSSTVTYY